MSAKKTEREMILVMEIFGIESKRDRVDVLTKIAVVLSRVLEINIIAKSV